MKGRHAIAPRQKRKLAQALRPGDVIRVVAPSSSFDPGLLKKANAWLEKRGYRVHMDRRIFAKEDFLAGADSSRQKVMNQGFEDPKARAIFCARGGYGAMRLGVPKVSPAPKVFMGFSDVTVLLNALARQGQVSVHGPVLASPTFLGIPEKRRAECFSYLENPKPRLLRAPRDFRILSPGEATGTLWGGNLSLVQSSLNTHWEIPCDRSLLFLEECDEPAYRLDRMLTQLALAGVFQKISGLILGEILDTKGNPHPWASLKKRLLELMPGRSIPILAGLKAGHRCNEVWLPIGGRCEIGQGGKRLTLSPLVRERTD